MDAAVPVNRRAFWLSFGALVVALPVAVAVHSWDSVSEWRVRNVREQAHVERGQSADYSAAIWALARAEVFPGADARQAVVLIELDAIPKDVAAMSQDACTLSLVDKSGRRWLPTMLIEPVARKAHPEVAEKSVCGAPAFDNMVAGSKAQMAATFIVPTTAVGLNLSLSSTLR